MATESPLLLGLDLGGTFAFALNGALTAVHAAKLDIVGVVTLGMVTALGGGILRDILIDALPPATFTDWRYLAVATGGGLIAFLLSIYALRDVLIRQVPTVLSSELYAIPALVGASVAVITFVTGTSGLPADLGAAVACFGIRMLGVHYQLNAPKPPGQSS